MYYVKVEGKTLKDLKQGLERHLAELDGYGDSTVSVNVEKFHSLGKTEEVSLNEIESEEYTEVASPFANSTPSVLTPEAPRVAQGELDAEGIPWDERIHASSRAKVANGTWRTKRRADENLVYQIKSQYRSAAPVAPIATPVYEAPALVTPTYVAPVAQAPVVAAPLPVMNSNGHTLDTFKANFALIVGQLITAGKITQDYVNQLKAYFNLSEIWMATDEQKAQVFEQFVQYNFVQRV